MLNCLRTLSRERFKFVIKMDHKLKFQVDSLVNTEKIKRWNDEIVNINKYVKKNGMEGIR
jgi:hypothetical protein